MSNLIPFDFHGIPVRAFMRSNEPWFVARDIAVGLEYSNPRKAVRDHCKRTCAVGGGTNRSPLDLDPQTTIIPEPDVYRLIIRSNQPKAEEFEAWVLEEVLPTLRKHGTYTMPGHDPEPKALPSVPEASLRLKQDVRAQAMRAAVQTAKLDGGTSQDVKLLYAEFCELFAARPASPQVQLKSVPAGDAAHHALVLEFIDQEMEITDIKTQHGPTSLKSKSIVVYEQFKNWCRDVHGMTERNIPSHIVFGSVVKRIPGVKRVSPINRMFYNLVPKER